MGFLTQFTKSVLDVVVTPVTIVADVVTMGGVLTDKDEPYTATQAKKILKDVQDLPDSVDDGLL